MDVPHIECLLRDEFLYNLERGHGRYTPVVVFGAASMKGHPLLFHVMTNRGAVIWRLPIHAFCWKECEPQPLDHLQLWSCFSSEVAVTEFEWMSDLFGRTILKDGAWHQCHYFYTFDWYGSWLAESAGDTGHKCAHLLRLDNGNFALQPNNRILWFEPSFVTPYKLGERPDYLTNRQDWQCERAGRWTTTDTMFYDTEDGGDDQEVALVDPPRPGST